MSGGARGAERAAEARERLLAATLRCAVRDGAAALSIQAIALEASVSKALVLYHFRDKDALLATAVRWLADRMLDRQTNALRTSTPLSVLEDYWRWLKDELVHGEVRVFLELLQERGAATRVALVDATHRRRQAAEESVGRIFSLLELTPKVPPTLLASC